MRDDAVLGRALPLDRGLGPKESMCSDAQDDPRPTIAKWLTMRARPKTCESLLKLENYKANDYVQSFFFVDYRLYLACES